jgi:hypothetical protein
MCSGLGVGSGQSRAAVESFPSAGSDRGTIAKNVCLVRYAQGIGSQ